MKQIFKINSITRILDNKILSIGDCFYLSNEISVKAVEFDEDGLTVWFLLFFRGIRVNRFKCAISDFEKDIQSIKFSDEMIAEYKEIQK